MKNFWLHIPTIIYIIHSSTFTLAHDEGTPPLLEIRQGWISGLIETSKRNNQSYYAFKGIPYGRVGTRFEEALPAPEWDEILNATQFGPNCPQGGASGVVGVEDCLYINVYTPIRNSSSSTSSGVLLYIHGGGFGAWSGDPFGGEFFVAEDVVLVTFNYRVGPLGFLSSGDDVIQGNMGLKDQVLALKWVNENIEAFGGDKERIFIGGTSAGSASVGYHILSPMSAGLFHGAIAISGTPLCPWALRPNPLDLARELGNKLNCPLENTVELAACLRTKDFKEIVEVNLAKWYLDPLVPFAPVIETLREGQSQSQVFLSEDPSKVLETGEFNNVPVMYGIMEDEGLVFHSAGIGIVHPELQADLNQNWSSIIPITLMFDYLQNTQRETHISQGIQDFYFPSKNVNPQVFQNLTNMYSDRWFNYGARRMALLQAKKTNATVYPFIFRFKGSDWSYLNSFYDYEFDPIPGVGHGDDLRYLFNMEEDPNVPELIEGSREEEFSRKFVKLISSFIKNNGTPTSDPPMPPITLDDVAKDTLNFYYLDETSSISKESEGFKGRMNFWEEMKNYMESGDDDNGSGSSSWKSSYCSAWLIIVIVVTMIQLFEISQD